MRRVRFTLPWLVDKGFEHDIAVSAVIFNAAVASARLRGMSISEAIRLASAETIVAQKLQDKERAR